jgi:hypothetical protein
MQYWYPSGEARLRIKERPGGWYWIKLSFLNVLSVLSEAERSACNWQGSDIDECAKTRSNAEMKVAGRKQIMNQAIINGEGIKDRDNGNEFASW